YLARCRTMKTLIMFSNRRIGVILRDADVVVYDENNGSGFIAENSGSPEIGSGPRSMARR
ncbi:hypothetical protein L9F63_018813, partial [Diploptera punctata]